MRRPLPVTFAFLLLALAAAAATDCHGRVAGVTDGDTIKVLHAGRPVQLRLYGIDASEKQQPFGQPAKQYASEHAFRREATVRQVDGD